MYRDGGEKTADVLGFAFHFRSEDQRIQLEFARFLGCRIDEQPVVRDHAIIDILEYGISGLRRVRNVASRAFLKSIADGIRNIETVLLNDGERV